MRTVTLMRGLPGSGKSYTAQKLDGKVFSTDDFFTTKEGYDFDPRQLGQAHIWNQMRVETAMQAGESHIVVDNTNIMYCEMKAYVNLADKHGYEVEFVEAQSEWAWNVEECFNRNSHGVPLNVIANMKEKYQPIQNGILDLIRESVAPWEQGGVYECKIRSGGQ
jgi:NEDD4-binding protein 2